MSIWILQIQSNSELIFLPCQHQRQQQPPSQPGSSAPTPVTLQQQGQSAQHVPTVDGAHSLQQAEPVVSASTSNEHSPADTSDSIVSAQTSITSDIDNENTQVENAQQQTHDAIASD